MSATLLVMVFFILDSTMRDKSDRSRAMKHLQIDHVSMSWLSGSLMQLFSLIL